MSSESSPVIHVVAYCVLAILPASLHCLQDMMDISIVSVALIRVLVLLQTLGGGQGIYVHKAW